MAIMTLEQFCDTPDAERVATGSATVVVRDMPAPGEAQTPTSPVAGAGKPGTTKPGEPLPALTKHVTQAQIDAYADVSGDHNPIHLDADAARAVGLDGTIAHGMLGMAFAGQLLTDWLTASSGGWVARLRVRFQGIVRPGDTLTVRGAVGDGPTTEPRRVDVWIENQVGERVITGDAEVR
jgi:acyl dehydratase